MSVWQDCAIVNQMVAHSVDQHYLIEHVFHIFPRWLCYFCHFHNSTDEAHCAINSRSRKKSSGHAYLGLGVNMKDRYQGHFRKGELLDKKSQIGQILKEWRPVYLNSGQPGFF